MIQTDLQCQYVLCTTCVLQQAEGRFDQPWKILISLEIIQLPWWFNFTKCEHLKWKTSHTASYFTLTHEKKHFFFFFFLLTGTFKKVNNKWKSVFGPNIFPKVAPPNSKGHPREQSPLCCLFKDNFYVLHLTWTSALMQQSLHTSWKRSLAGTERSGG